MLNYSDTISVANLAILSLDREIFGSFLATKFVHSDKSSNFSNFGW